MDPPFLFGVSTPVGRDAVYILGVRGLRGFVGCVGLSVAQGFSPACDVSVQRHRSANENRHPDAAASTIACASLSFVIALDAQQPSARQLAEERSQEHGDVFCHAELRVCASGR